MHNRDVRKLVIALAVLLVLAVGADVAGRAIAESKAGEAIARKTGTSSTSVTIHGLSFLAQALPGHYSHISMSSPDLTAGPVTGIAATVELYDIDFPLSDALKGDTSQLTAGRAELIGTIPDSAITAALPQTGVTISAGKDGGVRLSTTVTVQGQPVPVTADVVASYRSGILHLDATGITAAGIALPNVAQLTRNLSLQLPLTGLPFTVETATVTAAGTNVLLSATARNITMNTVGQ
jgi:hypothetical protein